MKIFAIFSATAALLCSAATVGASAHAATTASTAAATTTGQPSSAKTSDAKAKGAASGAPRRGPPPPAVNVMSIGLEDIPQRFGATGYATPLQSVEVRPQVSAIVESIAVKEGQSVKQGDVLFRLDSRKERAIAAKLDANYASAEATLAELQRQLSLSKKLRDEAFVSSSATATLESQFAAQQAQLKAIQADRQAQQIQLSLFTITAPISGRLGRIDVTPGTLVGGGASAAPLVSITQMDPMGVSFNLPQAQIPSVRRAGVGAPVTVRVPGQDEPLTGRLTFYDSQINADTGMMGMKASVANPGTSLWPGTTVQINLSAQTVEQVAVIPQVSAPLQGNERQVMLIDDAGLAQARAVEPMVQMGEFVAVRGLKESEKIVVDGRQNVKAGSPVRVIGPAILPSTRE